MEKKDRLLFLITKRKKDCNLEFYKQINYTSN